MELKKSIDVHKIVVSIYLVLMAIYLAIGFAPSKAEAFNYEISSELEIPTIGLTADVTSLRMKDGELKTPDSIVGSFSREKNKVFLVGHSSTVFQNLKDLKVGDEVLYDITKYTIRRIEILPKSEVNMDKLLQEAEIETLVIMTCAGDDLGGGDATHRLIITASV